MLKRLTKNAVLSILLLALFLRIAFFAYVLLTNPDLPFQPDTPSYASIADGLINHGRFVDTIDGSISVNIIRTPGYPVFLAAAKLIAHENYWVLVVVCQIFINLLSIYLLYKTAKLLFGNQAAIIAGLLFSLDFLSIYHCTAILSEIIFQFLVVLFGYFIVSFLTKNSPHSLVFAALSLAAATLVRPVSYYLFIPCAIGVLIALAAKKDYKKAIGFCVLFAFLAASPSILWQIRNHALTGNSEYSAISSINLYEYNAAGVIAAQKGTSFYDERDHIRSLIRQEKPNYASKYDYYKVIKERAIKIIKENIPTYAFLHLKGSSLIPFYPSTIEFFKLNDEFNDSLQQVKREISSQPIKIFRFLFTAMGGKLVVVLLELLLLAFYIGSLFIFLFKRNDNVNGFTKAFLIGLVAYFIIVCGGPYNLGDYGRFRLPIMPLLLLISSPVLWSKIQKCKCISRLLYNDKTESSV